MRISNRIATRRKWKCAQNPLFFSWIFLIIFIYPSGIFSQETAKIVGAVLRVEGDPYIEREGSGKIPIRQGDGLVDEIFLYEGDRVHASEDDFFASLEVGYPDASVEFIQSFPHLFSAERGSMSREEAKRFHNVHIAGTAKTKGNGLPSSGEENLFVDLLPSLRIFYSTLGEIDFLFTQRILGGKWNPNLYTVLVHPNLPHPERMEISIREEGSELILGVMKNLEKEKGGFLFDPPIQGHIDAGETYILKVTAIFSDGKKVAGDVRLQVLSLQAEGEIAKIVRTLASQGDNPVEKKLRIAEFYINKLNMPFEAKRLFK